MDDRKEALHDEIRKLTLLLSLVTANELTELSPGVINYPFEPSGRSPVGALDATAQILVRNDEVVAISFVNDDLGAPIGFCAMWEGPKDDGTMNGVSGSATAIPDPRDDSTDSQDPQNCIMILLQKGSSHWPRLEENPWFGLALR